jgi:hypothetical protein
MCLSCGCGEPNESHGDPRNITMQKLEEAAQAGGITPEQAAQNIKVIAQGKPSTHLTLPYCASPNCPVIREVLCQS